MTAPFWGALGFIFEQIFTGIPTISIEDELSDFMMVTLP